MEHMRLGHLLLRDGGVRQDLLEALGSEGARLPRAWRHGGAIASGAVLALALVAAFFWRGRPATAAPRSVEQGSQAMTVEREQLAEAPLPAILGGRTLGEPVVLSCGGAAGGFNTRGDWRPHSEGLRGTAAWGRNGGRAGAQAEVPEEFRLRMTYRPEGLCQADLLVATGRPGSSARFTLPVEPSGAWRTVEVVAIGDEVRCLVDGVLPVPPNAPPAPQGPRPFVGVAVEHGSFSIGDTTLEAISPDSRIR